MKQFNIVPTRRDILIFAVISVFSIFGTWAAHKGKARFDWRSEFWADKGGYYIYLPATFFYHFDFNKVPKDIDAKNGYGFVCDQTTKKIYTHYYYGESLLLSPFFLATHVYSKIFSLDEDHGFSVLYHRVMNFAAIFYFLLGIWFLYKFLSYYLEKRIVWFTILITFLGTNLMNYSMEDTLASHVFSFSLGAVFLFLVKYFLEDTGRYRIFLLMSLVLSILVVIRPTNILFFLAYFFLDIRSWKEILHRVALLVRLNHIIPLLLLIFVFFIPQMLYWKYYYGKYLITVYGDTGFDNWQHPRIAEVWFSTLNGLFIWNPVLLFFVAGMIFMIWKKYPNGIFILIFFFLITYIAASWKYWYWGASYGHRAYVEYFILFCLPFGILSQNILGKKNAVARYLFIFFVVIFTYMNFTLVFSIMRRKSDNCFFGATWDWNEFSRVLDKAGVIFPYADYSTYRNDFENLEKTRENVLSDRIVRNGMYSAKVEQQHMFCCKFSKMAYEVHQYIPGKVNVTFWVNNPFHFKTRAHIICSIQKDGKSYKWQSAAIDDSHLVQNKWTEVNNTFEIPPNIPGDYLIFIYILNFEKRIFYVDDMKIRFTK